MAVFRKAKMMARLEKQGITDIPEDAVKMMDILDGKEATTSCWRRQVCGEPVLWVSVESIPDGGAYVNEADCE